MSMELQMGEKVRIVIRPEGTYIYNSMTCIMVEVTSIRAYGQHDEELNLEDMLRELGHWKGSN